jgi:hypothetical protein
MKAKIECAYALPKIMGLLTNCKSPLVVGFVLRLTMNQTSRLRGNTH